jgi:L-asparaginase
MMTVFWAEAARRILRANTDLILFLQKSQRRNEYEAKLAATRIGTVGCVALDAHGRLAAATSPAGKFEILGRISDSATVAGDYANGFAA